MSDPVDRRDFLKTTSAAGSALALSAASAARVYGAMEGVGVAFLGVGGRCQQHIDVILEILGTARAPDRALTKAQEPLLAMRSPGPVSSPGWMIRAQASGKNSIPYRGPASA